MNFFEEIFESISDYRKIVLLMFFIKTDNHLLTKVGFNKNNRNQLSLEFKNILLEQNDEYLDYVKNEEESVVEKILSK